MRIRQAPLDGVLIIEPTPSTDERGLFARLYDADTFRSHGLPTTFVQASTSYSRSRGTLRGMHFQTLPCSEGKLIRCTAGVLFDVVVDIRRNSTAFGLWHGIELSSESRMSLYVPPGFAHGFITLTDHAEIHYQMTEAYVPEASRGFVWNDPDIAIAWPTPPTVISARDLALPRLTSAA
jgi:dTDP-4-dehydrorhamnose 3,5-epimerase